MFQNDKYILYLSKLHDKKFNVILAEIESEFIINKIVYIRADISYFNDSIRLFINKLVKTLCDKYTFNFIFEHIEMDTANITNSSGVRIYDHFQGMLHIYAENNNSQNEYFFI